MAPANVVWSPHPGSQVLFLSCPFAECLYTGTRGPGKTDALLMDFAQHVGRGWGAAWRGVLFRREYKPLGEVVVKSKKWFRRIFPGARFLASQSDYKWVFPAGEELLFRSFKRIDDYWDYHGHEYPWIGWEELTAWPSLDGYHVMKTCNRSSQVGIPLKVRATCNPYGPGHNVVKAYFIDPAPAGVPFVPEPATSNTILAELGLEVDSEPRKAVTIHGHYSENRALMDAQPNYPQVIASAARNPSQALAWLADDWDIVAGGMFDDRWRRDVHVLAGWHPAKTPLSWRIDRAFDWGSSHPFSVGWWAESDGTEAPNGRTYPRRSLFRIAEWYGASGPNAGIRMQDTEIARGIAERETAMGIRERVLPGPADTQIFSAEPGRESIADAMRKAGVTFSEADKRPGSRRVGWEAMRRMLAESMSPRPEGPCLYVFETCREFIRTVPTLPRSDRDPDDVDTEAEDHIADEVRYRVMAPDRAARSFEFRV